MSKFAHFTLEELLITMFVCASTCFLALLGSNCISEFFAIVIVVSKQLSIALFCSFLFSRVCKKNSRNTNIMFLILSLMVQSRQFMQIVSQMETRT